MATSTPMGGFPVPDNGDNINNMAGQVVNFGTAAEPYLLLAYPNAAGRDAVITSANAHVGQRVFLVSPGYVTKLVSISGSVLTWAEDGTPPLRCNLTYTIANPAPSGSETGVGVPSGSFGGGYGKGTNGPTVPRAGDYVFLVTASTVLVAGVPVGSSSYRSFLAVRINGTTVARVNFAAGEDLVSVAGITPLLNAGDEISATIYQNSGSGTAATGNVTWTVSRNSVPV